MGTAATLFNDTKPCEQIVNTLSTKGPVRNLVKIAPAVSQKKAFKYYTMLYLLAQGQGQIATGDKILIVTKQC